ncbi:hypothetical protein BKA83DRAFT_4301536 [Pisolithus microcarpus]|nr:hypothetical protein BKA83DRAFT_4301536 [Pisolithus microcarpus]
MAWNSSCSLMRFHVGPGVPAAFLPLSVLLSASLCPCGSSFMVLVTDLVHIVLSVDRHNIPFPSSMLMGTLHGIRNRFLSASNMAPANQRHRVLPTSYIITSCENTRSKVASSCTDGLTSPENVSVHM